jgi:hypothetical protein
MWNQSNIASRVGGQFSGRDPARLTMAKKFKRIFFSADRALPRPLSSARTVE